jgi:hypothetical protein
MNHYSHATQFDHGETMYSPVLFAVRPDLGQSAGGMRQLPLPPPGLSPTKKRRRKRNHSPLEATLLPLHLPPHSVPGSSSFGPILRPTSVVHKKSKIGRVHRSSANRSRILKRFFPLPVSLRTSAHRVFCCGFHRGQFLNRCSRVCQRLMAAWDGDPLRNHLWSCSAFQCPGESGALSIVGLLVVAHVGFDTRPVLIILPCDHVSGCSTVESRAIGEHGEPRP